MNQSPRISLRWSVALAQNGFRFFVLLASNAAIAQFGHDGEHGIVVVAEHPAADGEGFALERFGRLVVALAS